MKTGQDVSRSGLYVSECCLSVIALVKDQMFPRCPRCFALALWEITKPRLAHFIFRPRRRSIYSRRNFLTACTVLFCESQRFHFTNHRGAKQ